MIQSEENTERVESLNKRIYARNVPSQKIGAQFDPRPTSSRFIEFPDIDNKNLQESKKINNNLTRNYIYSNTFNPGYNAPYKGYVNGIKDENELYRINHINNRDCLNHFPNNWMSDMYTHSVNGKDIQSELNLHTNHSLLFKTDNFNPTNLNPDNLGGNLFSNNTRVERRGIE